MIRSFVEGIERLDEDIKDRNNDKRDIYAEARSSGFDVKALKAVIRLRAQDPGERQELEAIVDTYLAALGMTPSEGGEAMSVLDAALAEREETAEAA